LAVFLHSSQLFNNSSTFGAHQMANDFLGQILGSVLGGGGGGANQQSPFGGNSGGGLGDLLGSVMGGGSSGGGGLGGLGGLGGILGGLGGRGAQADAGDGTSLLGGGKGAALTALLLPLAMQWVQRNGGIGAVLERFQQKGYSQQAASWVSTGENQSLPPEAIGEVIGTDELSRLSQQLGASNEEVAGTMAQILPEVVNHMTPQGNVPNDSDDVLSRGISALEGFLKPSQSR
jgi:uncharacterized protein YidB (DUF937 family)